MDTLLSTTRSYHEAFTGFGGILKNAKNFDFEKVMHLLSKKGDTVGRRGEEEWVGVGKVVMAWG